MALLHFLSICQTSVYTTRLQIHGCVYRMVCLFMHQRLLVLVVHSHGGMARLSYIMVKKFSATVYQCKY